MREKNDLVELRRAFDSYKFSSLDIKNTIFYDSKTQNFHSILHAAVESNAPDVANFLVEKKPYAGQPAEAAGVNVNNTFETHGKAPLAYAAARLNLEALEFLIRKGASIAQEDLSGLNARHYAAYTLHQKARNTDKISAKLLQRYLSIDQQLKQTPISQSPIGQSLKRKDEQQFSYNAKRRPVENTFISKD